MLLNYLGLWNAYTNQPELVDGIGDAGDTYLITVVNPVALVSPIIWDRDLGSGTKSWIMSTFVYYTGSMWETFGTLTSGSAVTFINTTSPLTGGPITGSGTIGIPASGSSTDGYLTSVDWNIFNSKIALSNLTATPPLFLTPQSLTSGVLSIQLSTSGTTGALTFSDWIVFNSKQSSGNYITALTGDVTASGPGSAVSAIGALKILNSMLAGSIAASKLIGTDITTVGTITAGIWHGTAIDLASFVSGNLAVSHLNSGISASSGTFWRGDGTWATPSGTGISSISVVSANGLAGTTSGTTSVAITISTTITGILKGNGTAISAAVAGTDYVTPVGTETLINKRITKRVVSMADATSCTPTGDTADINSQTNTQALGNLTVNSPSGIPTDGQSLELRFKCTNQQTFVWNSIYVGNLTTALPTTSSGVGLTDKFYYEYSTLSSKWELNNVQYGS